jgi:hypothetical protein
MTTDIVQALYLFRESPPKYIIWSITQSTVTEIKNKLSQFETLELQCKFTIYLLKKYLTTSAIDNKIFEFSNERKNMTKNKNIKK